MAHAESVHSLQPPAGATHAIVQFVANFSAETLPAEVVHYAKRHMLDTVGWA